MQSSRPDTSSLCLPYSHSMVIGAISKEGKWLIARDFVREMHADLAPRTDTPVTKNNKIYDTISRLVNARCAFGDRILVKELGSETGASRQPIMAALNRLSADGLV